MPIDLDTPQSYLFSFADDRGTFVVSVPGRTETEARIRFARMSPSEKRASSVALMAVEDRDLIADLGRWIAARFAPLRARRAV